MISDVCDCHGWPQVKCDEREKASSTKTRADLRREDHLTSLSQPLLDPCCLNIEACHLVLLSFDSIRIFVVGELETTDVAEKYSLRGDV